MNHISIFKKLLGGGLLSVALLSSCNYLDVVPPEQAKLKDATKTYESTLAFLYSCYTGVSTDRFNYSGVESASDEWVLPPLWAEDAGIRGLWTPQSMGAWRWGNNYYRFIGQCHLFAKELEQTTAVTPEKKAEMLAEKDFLLGYYHMQLLQEYGPIPINDEYIAMDADNSEYPGRSHYDFVVDYIVSKFDAAAAALPANRTGEEWGRATSTMAKAYKSRLLVYAASPLWNGDFPYPDWKNKNYETPGYGLELVSKDYDPAKWERARQASQEALDFALANGYELFDDEELNDRESVALPYVPGIDPNTPEGKAFQEKVMVMRYAVTTRSEEGNKEIIWGHSNQGNMLIGSLPHFIQKHTNGSDIGGYSGVSPLLNTSVMYFYTNNGKRPEYDPEFTPKDQWFKSAGLPGAGRDRIINLNVHREPRFYAWFAFDGGDFSNSIKNGQPLQINMLSKDAQGTNYDKFPRDNNVTGYFSQKYFPPKYSKNLSGNDINNESKPRPLFRMAELYLNLAEAEAALGHNAEAFQALNVVRDRAGVPDLTTADISTNMTATDWVRNERFIELWGEGHRYYDVRRWMLAPQTMASGVRTGLTTTIENPTFEEFNTPVVINQPYVWTNRMYLRPVFYNEVYKNPQMVQAPGY